MTQPTDAQIEVEARARAWDALTDQGKLAWRLDAKAALTAAGEVGSHPPKWKAFTEKEYLAVCRNIESATLERCAKFAENYFEMEYEKGYGEMIADAMREELLKDKP